LEELPLPSVGASFKKWGRYTPILPKALAHFPNFQKFIFFKIKKFQKNWDSPAGTGIDPRPAGDQRSPAGRGSTPGAAGLLPFLLNFFFFLPSTFSSSGQLFVIGCSTCPPCPDFSLKLQTSITFDP
jgi:hypothetical protein